MEALSENHRVRERERGTVNSRQREGFRQKNKTKENSCTLETSSITLILWNIVFCVPTVLLISELCELTGWGPPMSE